MVCRSGIFAPAVAVVICVGLALGYRHLRLGWSMVAFLVYGLHGAGLWLDGADAYLGKGLGRPKQLCYDCTTG